MIRERRIKFSLLLVLLVMKDGKLVHQKHFGFANIEDQVPVQENTI